MNYKKLAKQDLGGKIWFMPTDTIPGLSCLVRDDRALEKIRELKKEIITSHLLFSVLGWSKLMIWELRYWIHTFIYSIKYGLGQ